MIWEKLFLKIMKTIKKREYKMDKPQVKTLKELKKINYKSESIKAELARNLKTLITSGKSSFNGIYGYKNTVIPDLERSILSGHNIIFLGLRGQAKTRLARQMIDLLDEWIPVIKESEINDDPLAPISKKGKDIIQSNGDKTQIDWIHRSDRFYEKLATPDVTVADLIGDIDPIKAASLKLSYSDEQVIHYGMIPRANRSIFVLNELPDLQARIQVSLFSILEEKEIQIRGFKLRIPLDIHFVFTANPEDYTNRGSIVTPLKDRIGSQIITHYPLSRKIGRMITEQESSLDKEIFNSVYVPDLAKDLVEQINLESRKSEYVDQKSGVSARMSITAYENLISTAYRRALINKEKITSVRLTDFLGIIPSINGKIELVYEGEQEGVDQISFLLINEGIKTIFNEYFPKIKKLEKPDEVGPYDDVLGWFIDNSELFIGDDFTDKEYKKSIDQIESISKLVKKYCSNFSDKDIYFIKEVLLWGLSSYNKLSKKRTLEGLEFKDSIGSYLKNLNS